jgi:hypothetical protein
MGRMRINKRDDASSGRMPGASKGWRVATTAAGLGLAALTTITLSTRPLPAEAQSLRGKVLVELFSSQGCPLCPRANEAQVQKARRADVLALTYSVTYFNYLGWRDPYAMAASDRRQRLYANRLGLRTVYTPQIVINGNLQLPGGNTAQIDNTIRSVSAQPVIAPRITIAAGRVQVARGPVPARPAEITIVQYRPGNTQTPITRGDNANTRMTQVNIVQRIRTIGAWSGQAIDVAAPECMTACAVIVQETGPYTVLGVGNFVNRDFPVASR